MSRKIKIVYFGTPEFAVPPLESLFNEPDFEVSCVITQPDKPVGRRQQLEPSAVKSFALANGINILQPDKIRKNQEFLELVTKMKPDFIITAAYGQILPSTLLQIPKFFCINIHGSLLPKYRGASPVEQALLNGDTVTGITFIKMDEGMDTGDILLTQRIQITPGDDNVSLRKKLSVLAAKLLPFLLKDIVENEYRCIKQDHKHASYCKKIEKSDGELNPVLLTAQEMVNRIKAFNPWPSTYIFHDQKRIKILDAEVYPLNAGLLPGQFSCSEGCLLVGGKDKTALNIKVLQVEGKKPSNSQDFMRGHSNFFSKSPAR